MTQPRPLQPATSLNPSAGPRVNRTRVPGRSRGVVGVIAKGPLAGLPKRPGADRLRHLTPRQIQALINAEGYAERRGHGFTAHATIHWRCDPAFDPASWSRRLSRFLDKLGRWLQRGGIPVAFVWVNEIGREYGEHTHLLLHLPKPKRNAALSFQTTKAVLEAWIIDTENFATDKRDRFGKPWPPVEITGGIFGMHNRRMRSGVCRYLLKGMDPKDVAYTGFGIEQRAKALGVRPKASVAPIPNQRSGTSRTLGIAARRAAGWTELRSLEDLHARLNPP